ncbi:hypothetical protein [Pseudoalteromonas denitrificans]|uniref:hydroxymethylglutaryl-CoA reductase (NADPH) n=1 Tax=Pseudoalteromonas denitrificans DSM 6059 TaxID=1123010 RepID=A0A1I1QXR7_9GAMM|nr:hypothetical protein [Pseudoalteromonas denitrificans]SFD26921.1 3-hydroxy-3-methylglutaryl-coenzyme A reductase [Pseudoalteromonas denitrificans DSM 6059]
MSKFNDESRFMHSPIIHMTYKDNNCEGILSDYNDGKLQISFSEKIDLVENDEIQQLFVNKKDVSFSLEKLKVVKCNVHPVTKLTEISVKTTCGDSISRMRKILNDVVKEKSSIKTKNLRKIPASSGAAHYESTAIKARLDWCKSVSGSNFNKISDNHFNAQSLAGNIENYIGAVQIPIGLAGPVRVNGKYADGYIPVPIATTEGCLVSSICRGAKACDLSGGIEVHVAEQNMVRAPVFLCETMQGAVNLQAWVVEHHALLVKKAESVSSVAKLVRIEPLIFGDSLHLRFCYHTGDAAGQNMTSAATWFACEWMEKQISKRPDIQYLKYLIEGNMSGDKKANALSLTKGRGISVTARCFIPDTVLRRILHLNSDELVNGWHQGEIGASAAGMLGSNVNFANVIAGIFTATGQDIACVHESAIGVFKIRKENKGAVVSLYLPSLVIGTVGGGTALPSQNESLALMGCAGSGKVKRFAEIIAATCLSLDISTVAAIITNEFVQAHERLGRNRPADKLTKNYIDLKFLNNLMSDKIRSEKENLISNILSLDLDSNSGIVNTLTSEENPLYGIHRYLLSQNHENTINKLAVVLKVKPPSEEIILTGAKIARMSGEDTLSGLYEAQSSIFGFEGSHIRELDLYNTMDNSILQYCPKIYGLKADEKMQMFTVMMEDLSHCSHINTINTPSAWQPEHIYAVLDGLADMHKTYLDNKASLPDVCSAFDKQRVLDASELLNNMTRYNNERFNGLFSKKLMDILDDFLNPSSNYLTDMAQFPMTLTHNDFNTRNIALRIKNSKKADNSHDYQLVTYDWELACYQNPQRDLVEFLIYALPVITEPESYQCYVNYYIEKLEENTGKDFDRVQFYRVLLANGLYMAITRFNLYLMAHNVLKLEFIERVFSNLSALILVEHEQQNSNKRK